MGEEKETMTSTLYYVLVGRGGLQGLVKGLGDLHNNPQTLVMVIEVGLRVEVGYPLWAIMYMENIVSLTGRAGGAPPQDLERREANH